MYVCVYLNEMQYVCILFHDNNSSEEMKFMQIMALHSNETEKKKVLRKIYQIFNRFIFTLTPGFHLLTSVFHKQANIDL